MRVEMRRKIIKGVMWTIAGLLGLVVAIVALLYIPAVQNKIKDIALDEVEKSTGMKVEINRFRLYFPLEIELGGVSVVDSIGDTMVVANSLRADVRLLPLLRGEVVVPDASLDGARYRMGAPDSAICLVADVNRLMLSDAYIGLTESTVAIESAELDGGVVDLILNNDTVDSPPSDTPPAPWIVNANRLTIKNLTYGMTMPGVMDSLNVEVDEAVLDVGIVDMARNLITAQSLSVNCDSLLYALTVAPPQSGLDVNYIKATEIAVKIDSFYNHGTEIRVPLTQFNATERCGVKLNASGLFAMDSLAMNISDFDIETLFSTIHVDGGMGLAENSADAPVLLLVDANIGIPDVEMLYPSLKPLLTELPRYNGIEVKSRVDGTMADVEFHELSVALPRYLNVLLHGNIRNVTSVDDLAGNITIDGTIHNVDFVKPSVLEARLAKQVEIPPMTLRGDVAMNRGIIDGQLDATTGEGRVAMDARWNGRVEDYDLSLVVDTFPVNSFLPEMGMKNVTAHVEVEGAGFDITKPSTKIDARLSLDEVEYKGKTYGNMRLWAKLDSCVVDAGVVSLNDNADFDVLLNGNIEPDCYNWTLSGDVRRLDLKAVKLSDTPLHGSLSLTGNGSVSADFDSIDANVTVSDLDWTMGEMNVSTSSINTALSATDSLTKVVITNNDLNTEMEAQCSMTDLATCMTAVTNELSRQTATRQIDVSLIQKALPQFYLDMTAGKDNALNSLLKSMDMSVGAVDMSVNNDSLLTMNFSANKFISGTTRLDNIGFNAFQQSKFMLYRASIDNKPGTMDAFAHVSLNGYIAGNNIGAYFRQRNIQNETGYNLGLVMSMTDSVVAVKFTPLKPVIAYKNWTVNENNRVEYNLYTHHFDANLQMSGGESRLHLYTEHSDSMHGQEDVILKISDFKLADWMAVSPFAPPVKGDVSADMRFRWDERSLSGNGMVSLDDLVFGRDRVGSFLLDVGLMTDKSGVLRAETSLMVDSVKTITAVGTLNDSTSTSPVNLDFSMIRFPLHIINPFMPPGTAKMSGILNGEMDITGELTSPVFNGYIDFDSSAVKVDMIGSSFRFSEEKVPVENNVITFKNYTITGVNDNPLYINGTFAIKDLSPVFDLSMMARNMQFMGNNRGKHVDVYGKGFLNVDATIRGDMDLLNVNTTLNLLPGTNLTYVMTDAASTITSQKSGDMVKFVRFEDLDEVENEVDTVQVATGMAMNLNAMLIVSEGTMINVDMSPDGKNKVQLQGSGSLNYTMNNMSDSRVTGRYTINKGFVRYTPPLMSEKHFDFVEGSYVAFNGDMLNPILNINAVDNIRANVTREGQDSRLVNFDVKLSITNTLSNMNVEFDLSTPDDLTIQNELQSMSAEQRANQAMNMLLYNVYTGQGTRADGNLAGNPLFSLLESRINTWAANNIKFVDISFGIDRYDSTSDGATSTTTNYSYKVSKTLFNDRFKIIVGGNYSTDADTDENFSQNLINDISFEYMLNRSGSMYVKIFRHVGYESILEGEVTQTGVGFVYKRKIHSLRDLFRKTRKHQSVLLPQLDEAIPNNDNSLQNEKK